MRSFHRSSSSSSMLSVATRKASNKPATTLYPFSHNGLDYYIRQAEKEDLSLIDGCNRANLPENYGREFYMEQLQKFPELTLIAEKADSKEFIGYALGQIRPKPQAPSLQYFNPLPVEYEGHVGSIAIYKEFRGHKVALNLMTILHHRIAAEYGIDRVSLFCRESNQAALQLYSKALNYKLERVVPFYYADLEDGSYMVATGLLNTVESASTSTSSTVESASFELNQAQQ